MTRALLVLGLTLPGLRASAKGATIEAATLVGSSAFEWTRRKASCNKIDAKLQKKLAASFVCTGLDPDGAGTASGKPLQATCHANKGRAEYLVFATAADCKEEQETQAANGE